GERPAPGSRALLADRPQPFEVSPSRLQHRRADQLAVAQPRQCLVGLLEREDTGMRSNIGFRRDFEKISAILPGQIGNRDDLPFAPENGIGKRGYIRHVNAGAYDAPTLAYCA